MTRQRRMIPFLLGGAVLVAVAIAAVVVLRPRHGSLDAWAPGFGALVRIVDGNESYDVELTDFAVIEGRVAYQGPTISVDSENWKPSHIYRGVDLAAVLGNALGESEYGTVTAVALDGWNKTIPRDVVEETTACGRAVLALSIDDEPADDWEDGPLLLFLPEDERLSNQDMLDAFGPEYAHFFGKEPSSTGLLVKGVVFLVIDHDGGRLPTVLDL